MIGEKSATYSPFFIPEERISALPLNISDL